MSDDELRAKVEQIAGKAILRMTREKAIAPNKLGEAIARDVLREFPELAPSRPATTSFAEASKRAMDLIARRVSGDEAPIPLPFQDLTDQFGGGLWPGLHFVTSTTGTGKTALALQIARCAALKGSEVLYVPLELDAPQLAIRMISDTLWDEWRAKPQGEAPPSWSDAYEGRMSTTTGTATGHAALFNDRWRARFEGVKIPRFNVIEATPGSWDAMTLEAELDSVLARGIVPKHPPLIVVDFLQLVGPLGGADGGKQDARERIGLVAYHLRDLARRRGVAVLVISSTARTNYGQFYGEKSKDSDKAPRVRFNDGTPRKIDRGYLLEGSGKESGEVEYAADSVSALLQAPDSQSIFATVKGRSRGPTRPQWCALRFEGGRFVEGVASAAANAWNEGARVDTAASTAASTASNAPRTSHADPKDI